MIDPAPALFGLLVGFLVGLTGVGGGSLMTPFLVTVVGVPAPTAVGTDLTFATAYQADRVFPALQAALGQP